MQKIGKHAQAKKYAELREKQALANRMIKNAKTYLKPDHKALKTLKAKKRTFYQSRGLRTPSLLSFKNLTKKDLPAYERLLDSIINDTYLNEEKYNNFRKSQREKFHNANIEDVDGAIEVLESDIMHDLMSLGLPPSEIIVLIGEYQARGFNENDFLLMCKMFMQEFDGGNTTIDDFFAYADYFMTLYDDFNARVDMGEYKDNEFADYLYEYYNASNMWVNLF